MMHCDKYSVTGMKTVRPPEGYYLRTLVDPVKGVFGDFDPDYFCDRTSQNTPFNSTHVIWETNGLWIGEVRRDMPGELWQIYLIGHENPRGAWEDFQTAIDKLFDWHKQYEEYKRSHQFKSDLANLKPQNSEPTQTVTKKKRQSSKKSA